MFGKVVFSVWRRSKALDVFKKARPSALVQEQLGFLQKSNSPASKAKKAQALLVASAKKVNSPQMNLLLYTLNSQLKLSSQGKARLTSLLYFFVVKKGD